MCFGILMLYIWTLWTFCVPVWICLFHVFISAYVTPVRIWNNRVRLYLNMYLHYYNWYNYGYTTWRPGNRNYNNVAFKNNRCLDVVGKQGIIKIWNKVIFIVVDHAQIETHAQPWQKMIDLIGIPFLGHLKCHAINLALKACIASWGWPTGTGWSAEKYPPGK